MKDLDKKAKLEDTLQPAPSTSASKVNVHLTRSRAYTPRSTANKPAYRFPSSTASKNLRHFPTMDNLSTTSGKHTREKVAYQEVNTFILAPQIVDQLGDISQYYDRWANLTTDSFVLDIAKHGMKFLY